MQVYGRVLAPVAGANRGYNRTIVSVSPVATLSDLPADVDVQLEVLARLQMPFPVQVVPARQVIEADIELPRDALQGVTIAKGIDNRAYTTC